MNSNLWIVLFFADILVLAVISMYAFIAYYRKVTQLKKLESQAHEQAQSILERAHTQSEEILEKVESKATEILTHVELFRSDLEASFRGSLNQAVEKYLAMAEKQSEQLSTDYEDLFKHVREEFLVNAKKALDTIEVEVKKQLDESRVSLTGRLVASQEGFQKKIAEEFVLARKEIEVYKRQELQKTEKVIDDTVIRLTKELIRTSIPPEEHKRLVMEALDKAKQEGLFFL